MENAEIIRWLTAGVWVLALTLIWGMSLVTWFSVMELKRRKRTDDVDDDWRMTGN